MQDINIEEGKPNHTKAFVGIGIIIVFVILLGVYFQMFLSKNIIQEEKGDLNTVPVSLESVLSKTVNEKQKTDESLPSEMRSFLGKWKGEWSLPNGETLPAVLVVSEVVVEKGITASYGALESKSNNMLPAEETVTGNVIFLKDEGNAVALEIPILLSEEDEATQIRFWFTQASSQTLKGEFIDLSTGKSVKGTFTPAS